MKGKSGISNVYDTTLQRFPIHHSELDRFKFGRRKYFELASYQKSLPYCLDIACGAKPFPQADVLCDLHVKPVPDRGMKSLITNGKPFVRCNCFFLPFKDAAFDFVTSYYLVEHVADPFSLFKELKRVSKHGFVQSPSWFNELVYGEKFHKWIVLKHHGKLYVKPNQNKIHFGFIFHILYKSKTWRIFHAIFDEVFNIFTVTYSF